MCAEYRRRQSKALAYMCRIIHQNKCTWVFFGYHTVSVQKSAIRPAKRNMFKILTTVAHGDQVEVVLACCYQSDSFKQLKGRSCFFLQLLVKRKTLWSSKDLEISRCKLMHSAERKRSQVLDLRKWMIKSNNITQDLIQEVLLSHRRISWIYQTILLHHVALRSSSTVQLVPPSLQVLYKEGTHQHRLFSVLAPRLVE